MSNNNNSFLDSYNSKKPEAETKKMTVKKNTNLSSLKYEETSGFNKPPKKTSVTITKPNRKSKLPMAAGIIGAVVVLAVIIVLLTMGGGVEVKDFTDWELKDVQLWAQQTDIKLQIEEEFNDKYEASHVISQSVEAGTKIKKGEFLQITVSKGHDLSVLLPLPDLKSMTKDEIEKWAEENYMTKVRITTENSDTVPAGNVIRFEINDNTVVNEVKRDTPIYVIVSKGPEDESEVMITIPDFKTKSLAECHTFAQENGLILKIEEKYDEYTPKGSIITQSVKPDEKVNKGSEILLTVSKGKQIIVPDFSSYSKDKATTVASQLGIPLTIKERYSSSSIGRCIYQSLDAGTVLEEGDFLELTYSLGKDIVVGSYVGQTVDAIEAWRKELNEKDARITLDIKETQSNQPTGTIIHQDPANEVISRKTTITITVSTGKVIYVPNFVGSDWNSITREKAIEMCEELNIIPVFELDEDSDALPGAICAQKPLAGTEVTEGSTIELSYAPTKTEIKIESFIGKTKEKILNSYYYQVFDITFVEQYNDLEDPDIVYEQTKPNGDLLLDNEYLVIGSSIILTINTET